MLHRCFDNPQNSQKNVSTIIYIATDCFGKLLNGWCLWIMDIGTLFNYSVYKKITFSISYTNFYNKVYKKTNEVSVLENKWIIFI